WLQDQDSVVNHLESKVRIQLFGHKHSQRVQTINETLRITAGAMHPERDGGDWEPIYNVIEIERRDDQSIGVRLFQRRWHKIDCRFVADHDSNTGKPHREYIWKGCARPAREENRAETPGVTRAEFAVSDVVAAKTMAKNSDSMPPPNYERRLTFRFLT